MSDSMILWLCRFTAFFFRLCTEESMLKWNRSVMNQVYAKKSVSTPVLSIAWPRRGRYASMNTFN